MAFAPTAAPPSAQQLSQIAEALCARAEARERACLAAARKRHALWKKELSTFRKTSPPVKVATVTTGAAAVLQARLARIVPPAKTQAAPTAPTPAPTTAGASQSRIDAYNERMARLATYFNPATPVQVAPSASVTDTAPAPESRPVDKPPKRVQSRPVKVMEPALAAAPSRAAISPTPVKPLLAPMIRRVRPSAPKTAARSIITPVPAKGEQVKNEQVQRPSLVDAIVNAFNNFMDGMKNKSEQQQEKPKEPDTVAIGAAAQVLAVFMSLGKH